MPELPPHLRLPCLLLLAIGGCGDAELSSSQAGVATNARADARCEMLAEGESLSGVSPNGEAWVEGDDGMRRVLPDGTATLIDAGFTRADELVGWDSSSAFVVGDNTLWNATLADSAPMALPPELGKPRFICGDPRNANGSFIVSTRGLFERREGDWLRWAVPIELLESMKIRTLEGACSGQTPVMYIEAQQSLWEAQFGDTASFREVADLTNIADTNADLRIGLLGLRDGDLVRFDAGGWAAIPFDEGTVTAMSAADGVLWASVDSELYRRDRFEKWERLETATWPVPIATIESYAAGSAWIVKGDQLCHVSHRDTLRVDGVRPYQRLSGKSGLSLQVSGDPAMGSSLNAGLDGHALSVTGNSGAWTVTLPDGIGAGWHSLALLANGPQGRVRRTLEFLVEDAAAGPLPPSPEATVFGEQEGMEP